MKQVSKRTPCDVGELLAPRLGQWQLPARLNGLQEHLGVSLANAVGGRQLGLSHAKCFPAMDLIPLVASKVHAAGHCRKP